MTQLNALRGKALEEACRKSRRLDGELIEKDKLVQQLSLQVRFDRVLRESEHLAIKAECERLRQEIDQVLTFISLAFCYPLLCCAQMLVVLLQCHVVCQSKAREVALVEKDGR